MTYEGWANYHTWNVSLWLNNDESLYRHMVKYANDHKYPTYKHFIRRFLPSEYGDVNFDGVSWTDPTLDHEALDAMITDHKEAS